MAFTVAGLAAELGIDPKTLESKADVVAKYDGYFTQAGTQYADAAKLKADAETLQAAIDSNITGFALTENRVAELEATIVGLKAAKAELEKKGFKLDDLKIPELPAGGPKKPTFEDNVAIGFNQMGQTMNELNRYFRVFGKPLPEDPTSVADNAAKARMTVHDYVEQTYKVAQKEKEISDAAAKAHDDAIAAAAVKKFREDNPSYAGHPEMNGGLPSNHPSMPKPMETKDFRSFSNMSTKDKISAMVGRAQERLSQATQ